MTGELPGLDPLAAVRTDAALLDALAAGETASTQPPGDPAVALLGALRAEIDAAVASGSTPGVRRDAALLDALAAGASPAHADPALGLLHTLRAVVDGVTGPADVPAPEPAPVLQPAPAAVLVSAGSTRRRRLLRGGVAAGSVALALSMSGVAAAAYSSHPGSSLYGLRTQTFGRTDDDPVAAEQVLAALQQQAAVAVAAPQDPALAAKARATFSRFTKLVSAERNPVVQQSIAARASTVVTTLAVLPAPVAPVGSASPRPVRSQLADGHPGASVARRSTPVAVPQAPSTAAAPALTRSPDASPGVAASPVAGETDAPSGLPSATATGSVSASVSPSATASPGSPDAGTTPSLEPTESGSPTGSPSDSPSTSATASTVRADPTARTEPARSAVPVRSVKPKAKTARKKKSVTATLMTAQLPTSPQR